MNALQEILKIHQVLSDETRMRIWILLQDNEVCVCHIAKIFDLANSTISEHLRKLKKVNLLTARKRGKWVYYKACLAKDLPAFTTAILAAPIDDKKIHQDRERLKNIKG